MFWKEGVPQIYMYTYIYTHNIYKTYIYGLPWHPSYIYSFATVYRTVAKTQIISLLWSFTCYFFRTKPPNWYIFKSCNIQMHMHSWRVVISRLQSSIKIERLLSPLRYIAGMLGQTRKDAFECFTSFYFIYRCIHRFLNITSFIDICSVIRVNCQRLVAATGHASNMLAPYIYIFTSTAWQQNFFLHHPLSSLPPVPVLVMNWQHWLRVNTSL